MWKIHLKWISVSLNFNYIEPLNHSKFNRRLKNITDGDYRPIFYVYGCSIEFSNWIHQPVKRLSWVVLSGTHRFLQYSFKLECLNTVSLIKLTIFCLLAWLSTKNKENSDECLVISDSILKYHYWWVYFIGSFKTWWLTRKILEPTKTIAKSYLVRRMCWCWW